MELMTLEETANYLRVTTRTIYRLIDKHDIPVRKVGRQWRFDKVSIDAWLSQNRAEKTARILVIDDDETICSLFRDILEGAGYFVMTTNWSSAGLELVKNQDYDLVFLDLKMPEMDGPELFRQIRLARPELPVTIITAYPDSDLMMSALAHGPLGVMRKPFVVSDILSAVRNYLRFGMTTN
jgi:excisionase family DNA binding protein